MICVTEVKEVKTSS